MSSKHENEKLLKRFLKKRVSYSMSLLVGFLISGSVVASAESSNLTPTEINNEKETLLNKLSNKKVKKDKTEKDKIEKDKIEKNKIEKDSLNNLNKERQEENKLLKIDDNKNTKIEKPEKTEKNKTKSNNENQKMTMTSSSNKLKSNDINRSIGSNIKKRGIVKVKTEMSYRENALPRKTSNINIEREKEKIRKEIARKTKRIDSYIMRNVNLLREANYYAKPPETGYFISALLNYKSSGNIKKNWKYGTLTRTNNDGIRNKFNQIASVGSDNNIMSNSIKYSDKKQQEGNKSSGWLTNNKDFSNNMVSYDHTAKVMVLPVVNTPIVEKINPPKVQVELPKEPMSIQAPSASVPVINAININASAPTINLATASAPPTILAPKLEEISINDPNIIIKTNEIKVDSPSVEFKMKEKKPQINIKQNEVGVIKTPTITPPKRDINIVNPDVDFFTFFSANQANYGWMSRKLNPGTNFFARGAFVQNYDITGGEFYSGIEEDKSTKSDFSKAENILHNDGTYNNVGIKKSNLLMFGKYLGGQQLNVSNVKAYIAGNPGTYTETGVAYSEAFDNPTSTNYPAGAAFIGLTQGNIKVSNTEATLYGRGAFLTGISPSPSKVEFVNTSINVYGEKNTLFSLVPAHYLTLFSPNSNMTGGKVSGLYKGSLNVNIYGKNNVGFLTLGGSNPVSFDNSTGTSKMEGSGNILAGVAGYMPDFNKFIDPVSTYTGENMTPHIKIKTDSYGDENIGILFDEKVNNRSIIYQGTQGTASYGSDDPVYDQNAKYLGIYQGQVSVKVEIGEKLAISAGATTQTDEGQILKTDYSPTTVDGNVAIFARSGQREGIIPTEHLGVPIDKTWHGSIASKTYGNTITFINNDKIHSLEIGQIDARFGKHSKNGYMIISEKGTIIDIAKPGTSTSEIGNMSNKFSDGINGENTSEADAASKTIVAYSTGKWDQAEHKLGSKTVLNSTDGTLANLQGKPSEINIHIPLNMTSKEGIAFFGDDYGIVNLKENAITKAMGHKSIIGYARDYGVVNIDSDIFATDNNNEASRTNRYENIGAYAYKNGTVNVNKNATIHGIGALANGINAKVLLNGENNLIKTGINGGIAALNGGYVKFNGGTIEHKDIVAGDHKGKLPFYADSNSKIDFTKKTDIDIYDGAVFVGDSTDYQENISGATSTRYNGMKNVNINIKADGVNIGTFEGQNVNWNGSAGLISIVKPLTKVNNITGTETYNWNLGLTDGTFGISSNTDYNSSKLSNVNLVKTKVTINSGVTLSSNKGNSIFLPSSSDSNSNSDSSITNKGKINITGGTVGNLATGAYTSYGQIINEGEIKVDNGVGAYGINGSKIENKGKIEITNSGYGIVGMASKLDGTLEDYGTDKGKPGKIVEIDNKGEIKVSGNDGIAIYADNNRNVARSEVIVKNNKKLSALGDNSIGIMVKGNTKGGTVTVSGTGASDISVGKNGVGIWGENSDINLFTKYGIEVKDDGIGILRIGNTKITGTDLNIKYSGTDTGSVVGISYENPATLTNTVNVTIDESTNTKGTVAAIYTKGDATSTTTNTLTNTAKLTAKTNAYGILSENVDIVNTGEIEVGKSGGKGGIGIYGKNSKITTSGDKLKVDGENAIGVYAESGVKDVIITNGNGELKVKGKKAIGIYLKDITGKFENSSEISLVGNDSVATDDKRIGIFLENSNNNLNANNAKITVSDNDSKGNNIGIYSKDSYLIQNADMDIVGVRNVGIFVETSGTKSNTLKLANNTKISVTTKTTADTDLSMGIYGKGKNITIDANSSEITVSPNSVGIYLDGDNSSTTKGSINYYLSSDTNEKIGIGAYYKGGSYGEAGTIKLESKSTATSGTNIIRPIGLYYGEGSTQNISDIEILAGQEAIGLYGKGLTSFKNTGNIEVGVKSIGAYYLDSEIENNGITTVSADNGIGLYFKDSKANTKITGNVISSGKSSIGVVVTGSSVVENKSIISSTNSKSIGIYVEKGAKFINKNKIESTLSSSTTPEGSTAGFTEGGTIENENTIISEYMGLYGNKGATIKNTGTVTINSGVGLFATNQNSTINLEGGYVKSNPGMKNLTGVVATDSAVVNLKGSNIEMKDDSVGISLDNGVLNLTSGNIEVGKKSTGIYGKNATINLPNYNGTIIIGDGGTGVYVEDSKLSTGVLNVDNTGTSSAVGIYVGGTGETTIETKINHTGSNLVTIYGNASKIINTADQTINDGGIGIYGKNNATISNKAKLNLVGDNSIGIYLDGGSKLTDIGTISGNAPVLGDKVGIFIENGDILGNSPYNFDIKGGVGIYLKNKTINYSGQVNVLGDSPSDVKRTIGIYASPTVTGTLKTGINMEGKDAIGLYLAQDTTNATNLTYDGKMTLSSNSTGKRGIGVYLSPNTKFALGNSGEINIGGTNNIGFYVNKNADLNISGGTVNNTIDGIFAYIDDGNITFTPGSALTMNYANLIVSGSNGKITNSRDITVGNGGLQGDKGALIDNTGTGIINGTTEKAKAMIGTGAGTTLKNDGVINLTGEESVGIYVQNGATGISIGKVTVGNKSVAYYSGTGGTLNVSGTTILGNDSSLFYGNGGAINYTGSDINLDDNQTVLTLADQNSMVNLGGKNISTGKNSIGVFVTGTGKFNNISGLSKISTKGTGIYSGNNNDINSGIDIDLMGAKATGILSSKNSNIYFTGTINSNLENTQGIMSVGTGKLVNSGKIKLLGASSIGIYGETSQEIKNDVTGEIELGKGTDEKSGVAIYGKNVSGIENFGKIKLSEKSVGIYGDVAQGTKIINHSSGTIKNTGKNNTGIYSLKGSVINDGKIELGDISNGIFVQNGEVENNNDIKIGNSKSSGIYGSGTTRVNHKSGTVNVGNKSVGIATESGELNVMSGAKIKTGENSTNIYTISGNGKNYSNLNLSDYSLGIYTKSGTYQNYGKITTGKSDVNSNPVEISVGMVTNRGKIENFGTIEVLHDDSVGMLGNEKNGIVNNNGVINVIGVNSYGIQSKNSKVTNKGTINVTGANSKGIAATGNDAYVKNEGKIYISGVNTQGIYFENGAKIENTGLIDVKGSGNIALLQGGGGILVNKGIINATSDAEELKIVGDQIINLGGDIIIKAPTVSIDNVTIKNNKNFIVDGKLDFNNIKIGKIDGPIGTISAKTFNMGQILIEPEFTLGTNADIYTIQYLDGMENMPNNGSLDAISHSVSFIPELYKGKTDRSYTIMLVRIPYRKLTKNTPAIELGKGLDDLYRNPKAPELKMFDGLKTITSKDELAATLDREIRGNIYANAQDRLFDRQDIFNSSYQTLKESNLYTRHRVKIGAIISGRNMANTNAGVEDYTGNSLGFMMTRESDHIPYARITNWNLGFARTAFNFKESGSSETAYGLNLGLGYEDFLMESKTVKYITRGTLTVNNNHTTRNIHLNNGVYKNRANYITGMGEWQNKIRYEDINELGTLETGLEANLDIGYAKMPTSIKETGDGMELDVKTKGVSTVRPGIGADIKLLDYSKKGAVLSVKGKVSADYELGSAGKITNQAKIKNGQSGYFDLETEKKPRASARIGVEIKRQSEDGHIVSAEASKDIGRKKGINLSINLLYKL